MNRPQNTELVMDPHVAQWFTRTVVRLVGLYAIGVGVAILLGGPVRFAGLSYQVAITTPGAPESWGLTAIVAGVVMTTGSLLGWPRVIAIGAVIGACWALLFARAFLIAAWQYDEANTTAPWAYGILFVLFGLIAGIHFAMQPFWRRRTHRKD